MRQPLYTLIGLPQATGLAGGYDLKKAGAWDTIQGKKHDQPPMTTEEVKP